MDLMPLIAAIYVFMAAVMALAWAVQKSTNNGGWGDVFWTFGTGVVGLVGALVPPPGIVQPSARQILVAALVSLWSLRLGVHMFWRVKSSKEDARYAGFRHDWGDAFQTRMFRFLQSQAPVSVVLCLAVIVAARYPAPLLGTRDLLGFTIFVLAIVGEASADWQLQRFKARHDHGAICDQGFWAWSRHPNYFFEWFSWLSYPVIAIDLAGGYLRGFAALGAPAVMFYILRYVSGVPPLELAMLKSRGEAFRAYQARTSTFFLQRPR